MLPERRRRSLLGIAGTLLALVAACAGPAVPTGPTSSTTTSGPSPTAATTSTTTTSTSTSTTTTIPLPPARAWEVPAAGIPTSPRSADWASRIWNHADAFDRNLSIEFGLDEPSNDYSIPVYSTAGATTAARIFRRPPELWNGHWDIGVGDTVPWNPTWLPSDGNDGFIVIVDPATGREWDIWALSTPAFNPEFLDQDDCLDDDASVDAGYDPGVHLCAAAVSIIRRPDGSVADTRTYRGNYPPPSGAGLQNTAGLATPAEVQSGAIRHALKLMVSPVLSMTGPACPPDVTSPDDPRVGTTCGLAIAPASKHERVYEVGSATALARMVPHGTRTVLDMTDAQIEAWLTSRGYTGRLRETARIFAVALRDYGMIQTDSTGGPALIQVSGGRNPSVAAAWRALGIADDGSRLLDGLMTADNLRVLAPPVNRCGGVVTTRACWADDIWYP